MAPHAASTSFRTLHFFLSSVAKYNSLNIIFFPTIYKHLYVLQPFLFSPKCKMVFLSVAYSYQSQTFVLPGKGMQSSEAVQLSGMNYCKLWQHWQLMVPIEALAPDFQCNLSPRLLLQAVSVYLITCGCQHSTQCPWWMWLASRSGLYTKHPLGHNEHVSRFLLFSAHDWSRWLLLLQEERWLKDT